MFENFPPEVRVKIERVYNEWLATTTDKSGKSFIEYATKKLGTKYYREILEVAKKIDENRKKRKKSLAAAAIAFATAFILGLSKSMRGQEED